MTNSRPSTHPLNLASMNQHGIAVRVLMFESTLNDIGENLHVAMLMHWKSATPGDEILVNDSKGSESHIFRVIIVGKRKTMKAT
jgi:hypothetical protein